MFMYHQTAWLTEFRMNRTPPSATATLTPPACRLRAWACWNGQPGQAPMPPFGSLTQPSQSSALSSVELGTVQSQLAWPVTTLAPGMPTAHTPRESCAPRGAPLRTSVSMTVLDDPSGIRWMPWPKLMHMTPPARVPVGTAATWLPSLAGLDPPSVLVHPVVEFW